MHKPACGLTRNEQTFAKDPDAHALATFHAEIIARERAAGLVVPPFCRDAFRAFDMHDFVQHATPAEAHRRAVGYFGHGFDHLRPCEQADRTGGSEGIQLCVSRTRYSVKRCTADPGPRLLPG